MENVTFEVDQGKIVFGISGRLDTTNAGAVLDEMNLRIKESSANDVVVDAQALEYISSAGLRTLLTICKNSHSFKVINVSRDVYEIFEITGFTEIMDIKKAYRSFNVDGLTMIGQGTCGKVYRLDDETIIKVFKPGFDFNKIVEEQKSAQKSFLNGIDTAISYDVVKVEEQFGVIYEMVNADTFRSCMKKEPDKIEYYIGVYSNFLKKMHSVHFSKDALPEVKPKWVKAVDYLGKFFDDGQKASVKAMLEEIEERDTFIHGDYNIGNLMYQNGKAILIDMADASIGHPIFDVAGVYLGFALFPNLMPKEYCEQMTGFNKSDNAIMWNKFCEVYFGETSEDGRKGIESQLRPYAAFRVLQASLVVTAFPEPMLEQCKKYVIDAINEKSYALKF